VDDGYSKKETWYVVFSDTDLKHWLFKFLKPSFKHVYAVKKSRGGQYWCVINARSSYIEVETEPVSVYPKIRDYAGDNDTIVKVKVDIVRSGNIHQWSLITCGCIIKGVLGINAWLCFTPYQLYKRIISWEKSSVVEVEKQSLQTKNSNSS
jgi:hypothetical protein